MTAGADCGVMGVAAPRAESDAEILLGQSCQLSGPLAPLTRELQESAGWCFEQVNAKGGVHGRRVRVVSLDDAYEPAARPITCAS